MKVVIFLFLIVLTYQDFQTDYEKCLSTDSNAADANNCKSVSLSNNMECCQVFTEFQSSYVPNNYICSPYYKTKITQEQIQQVQEIYRETYGFTCTNTGYFYSMNFKQTFDCPSQKFSINYNTGTYTDEEKQIFKQENYCLRLYYEGLIDLGLLQEGTLNLYYKEITKEDCSNAVMLPSSENIATCAYASFDFQLIDGSSKHLNTCLYIAKSTFDTKTLDQNTEQSFSSYTSINGMTITSFKIEINDKSGKSLSYDSKTGSFESTSNNKGGLIGLSKLLGLILIVCLV